MAYTPIRNPLYLDATPWPYLKGPNYTRPVFKEHTRQGNFVAQPLMVMPSLSGLGCMQAPGSPLDLLGRAQGVTYKGLRGLGKVEVPPGCWDSPGFKPAHDACLVTAQKKCDFAEPCTTQEHEGCLTTLLASSACSKPASTLLPQTSGGAWYTNPYYLALGAVVGVVMFSMLRSQEQG